MCPVIKQEHPQGMILLFTLGILALLAILGATIFLSTKDELMVSGETTIGRDAFGKADSTTHLATFLARAVATAESAGNVENALSKGGVSGRPEFVVVLNNFTLGGFQQVGTTNTNDLIKERYILATDGNTNVRPHVEVFYEYDNSSTKRQLIATASVAHGLQDPTSSGSLQDPPDDLSGGIISYLIISADGRPPLRGRNDPTPPTDPSNYYTGDDNAKHSIVNAIFRILS